MDSYYFLKNIYEPKISSQVVTQVDNGYTFGRTEVCTSFLQMLISIKTKEFNLISRHKDIKRFFLTANHSGQHLLRKYLRVKLDFLIWTLFQYRNLMQFSTHFGSVLVKSVRYLAWSHCQIFSTIRGDLDLGWFPLKPYLCWFLCYRWPLLRYLQI